jgi:hypothetical protein
VVGYEVLYSRSVLRSASHIVRCRSLHGHCCRISEWPVGQSRQHQRRQLVRRSRAPDGDLTDRTSLDRSKDILPSQTHKLYAPRRASRVAGFAFYKTFDKIDILPTYPAVTLSECEITCSLAHLFTCSLN